MDESPFAELPRELRDRIFESVVYEITEDLSYALEHCKIRETGQSTLQWLKNRHPILATCCQIEHECLASFFETNTFMEAVTLTPNKSERQRIPYHPTLQHISPVYVNRWDKHMCVDMKLPSILTQVPKNYLKKIKKVGMMINDDCLHTDSAEFSHLALPWEWQMTPENIIWSYLSAISFCTYFKTMIVDHLSLPMDKCLFQTRYKLLAFTDGNALRPVKRALRNVNIRDTVTIEVDMSNEAAAALCLNCARQKLQQEQDEKTAAIMTEIIREETDMEDSMPLGRQHPQIRSYLTARDRAFNAWLYRLVRYHTGLIEVMARCWNAPPQTVGRFMNAAIGPLASMKPRVTEQCIDALIAYLREPVWEDFKDPLTGKYVFSDVERSWEK